MSDVFISYARSTAKEARALEEALRRLGYGVWRDDELPAHRAYADVIEERLRSSKAVVVIWSADAVKSEWVQSEADHARSAHKLVQVSLDGSPLPMPFDRIQCADLAGWSGEFQAPGWQKVVASVAELVGRPPKRLRRAPPLSPDPLRPTARAVARQPGRRIAPIAGAAIVLVLGLAAATPWLLRDRFAWFARASPAAVAIVPFRVQSASEGVRYFADSLADTIQTALNSDQIQVVSRADAVALSGADGERKATQLGVRMLFDGSVADDGRTTNVELHLNDVASHATIWSAHFAGSSDTRDELKANVSGDVIGVLNCSARALRPGRGLSDPEVLSLYLHACDAYERSFGDPQATYQLLDALKQVTLRAPNFAPAFSLRAKFSAFFAPSLPPDQAAVARAEARDEANHALAVDPTDRDAFVAMELLMPSSEWRNREAVLRRGLAANPDDPEINGYLAQVVSEVGRVQEGADLIQKALAGNPLAIDWLPESAWYDALAGRTQQADTLSGRLATSWPRDAYAGVGRLRIAVALEDWDTALGLTNTGPLLGVSPPNRAAQRSFILAAKSPTPILAAKARADALSTSRESPIGLMYAIVTLARLGFTDDAFRLAATYQPGPPVEGTYTIFLFQPQTASMRRDRRFMELAQRIGLAAYWRATGKWPDFCVQPDLPYDCKAEAAKLAAAR